MKLSRMTQHSSPTAFARRSCPPSPPRRARASRGLESPRHAGLLDRLEHWIRRTLVRFAPESLKPTALAAIAMRGWSTSWPCAWAGQRGGGGRRPDMGVHPDPEADLPGAMRELAAGRLDRARSCSVSAIAATGDGAGPAALVRGPRRAGSTASCAISPPITDAGSGRSAATADWQTLLAEGKLSRRKIRRSSRTWSCCTRTWACARRPSTT